MAELPALHDLDADLLRVGAGPVKVVQIILGDALRVLEDCLPHGEAGKRLREIDDERLLALLSVPDDRIAENRGGKVPEHVLGEVDEIMIVGVGHVEFHHGELRVVADIDALVPEVAVELEHPLESADNEALQIELRSDSHVHVDVKGVVMGDERPCVRAARNGVHHGGLDFHEALALHVAADLARELRADHEGPAG